MTSYICKRCLEAESDRKSSDVVVERNIVGLIAEVLKNGELSVSALTRELEARRGAKLHRLEVTGYLKAMASLGILNSKRIPPSLVFWLKEDGESTESAKGSGAL